MLPMVVPPAGRPVVYASGANTAGDVRGFLEAGIPVGLAAPEINERAMREVEALAGSGLPVFIDSGAFTEMSADPAKQIRAGLLPEPGRLMVVKPISHDEWLQRLACYQRAGDALGGQLTVVAPDRVGDQKETLARLKRYAPEMRRISETGAEVLLAMQGGGPDDLSLVDFYHEASRRLGFAPTPAMPMKKAATDTQVILDFVAQVSPSRIHMLGLGLKNARTSGLLAQLKEAAPDMAVSLDANLITASVGRNNGPDGGPRALTAAQDAIRNRGFDDMNGEVRDDDWGIAEDYTDSISSPSEWLSPKMLNTIAKDAALTPDEVEYWRSDPDGFLQDEEDHEVPRYLRDPILTEALDRAWEYHLQVVHSAPRRMEAIIEAFRDHPAAMQYPEAAARARANRRSREAESATRADSYPVLRPTTPAAVGRPRARQITLRLG